MYHLIKNPVAFYLLDYLLQLIGQDEDSVIVRVNHLIHDCLAFSLMIFIVY